jgi:hypothetical protein
MEIAKYIDRVDGESAKTFLENLQEMGVGFDDPRIEVFLDKIDLIDKLYGDRTQETNTVIQAALDKNKPPSISDISKAVKTALSEKSMSIDYQRLAQVVEYALAENQSKHEGNLPPNFNKFLLGGIASFSLLLGITITGLISSIFWLPQQIESRQLQNTEEIKYLGSPEGKTFRAIVKLNSGYLDTSRCKDDAKKMGYYMTKGTDKIINVCLVVMPK